MMVDRFLAANAPPDCPECGGITKHATVSFGQSLPSDVLEEAGIKEPAVQKDLHERLAKSLREYPLPEPVGIQNALDSLTHPNARTMKPANLMDTSILEEIKKAGFIDKLYGRPPRN